MGPARSRDRWPSGPRPLVLIEEVETSNAVGSSKDLAKNADDSWLSRSRAFSAAARRFRASPAVGSNAGLKWHARHTVALSSSIASAPRQVTRLARSAFSVWRLDGSICTDSTVRAGASLCWP